jgi:hypothetical protein
LNAHWGGIAGADFFTTDVRTWRGLVKYYTVFVIDLASRRVQILGSALHPEALFMQQIVRALTMAGFDNRLISGPLAIKMTSRVRRRPRFGGLLNFYEPAA